MVRPLLLWQMTMSAAMYSCYYASKMEDSRNLAKRLALCCVMIALLPDSAVLKRSARIRALAREAERAATLPLHREPQRSPCPAVVKDCPVSNAPPQRHPGGVTPSDAELDAPGIPQGAVGGLSVTGSGRNDGVGVLSLSASRRNPASHNREVCSLMTWNL